MSIAAGLFFFSWGFLVSILKTLWRLSGSLSLKPGSVTYSYVGCVLLLMSPGPIGLRRVDARHTAGLGYSSTVWLHALFNGPGSFQLSYSGSSGPCMVVFWMTLPLSLVEGWHWASSLLVCTRATTEIIPHIFGKHVQCLSSKSPLCCNSFLACSPFHLCSLAESFSVWPTASFLVHCKYCWAATCYNITLLCCIYPSYFSLALVPIVSVC